MVVPSLYSEAIMTGNQHGTGGIWYKAGHLEVVSAFEGSRQRVRFQVPPPQRFVSDAYMLIIWCITSLRNVRSDPGLVSATEAFSASDSNIATT